MPQIFISYRREDSQAITGRINDRLEQAFSADEIFIDTDDIRGGMDFREQLLKAAAACKVMLVIIGPGWLESLNKRLADPEDWHRFEVEQGLIRREAEVIPVLVAGAPMPAANQLPDKLKALVYRNAITVRNDPDFGPDVERLIERISSILGERPKPVPKPKGCRIEIVVALIAFAATLGAAALGILPDIISQLNPTPTPTLTFTPTTTDTPTPTPTATDTPTPLPDATDIGVVEFLNAAACENLTAESLVARLNVNAVSARAQVIDIDLGNSVTDEQYRSAVIQSASRYRNKLAIWGACEAGGRVLLHYELLLEPVLYQVDEPASVTLSWGEVDFALSTANALRFYLSRDYVNAYREFGPLAAQALNSQSAGELKLLEGNSRLFLGCYEDAIEDFAVLSESGREDSLLSFAAINNAYVAQTNLALFNRTYALMSPEFQEASRNGRTSVGVHLGCSQDTWGKRDAMIEAGAPDGDLEQRESALRDQLQSHEVDTPEAALAYLNLGMAGYLVKDIGIHEDSATEDCTQAKQRLGQSPNLGDLCLAMAQFELYYLTIDVEEPPQADICERLLPALDDFLDKIPAFPELQLQAMTSQAAENAFLRGYVAAEWVVHQCDLSRDSIDGYRRDVAKYYPAFSTWLEAQELSNLVFMSSRQSVIEEHLTNLGRLP